MIDFDATLESDKVARLLAEIVSGRITDISPRLDLASELGFTYPAIEECVTGKNDALPQQANATRAMTRRM